jgi:tetratricopeptide (TPR) repeat protein
VTWGEYAIQAAKALGCLRDLGRLYAIAMGWAAIKRGELDRASEWLDEGLRIIKASNDQELECAVLRLLGRLRNAQGQSKEALRIYQSALTMARARGSASVVAGLNSDLAYWEMRHGTPEEAERYIRESIAEFEDLDDSVRVHDRSIMLANILVHQGKSSEAEEWLLPNLASIEEGFGHREAVAHGYACLAHIRASQGNVSEAKRYCADAREVYERIGMQQETFPIGLPSICEE